eukprot:5789056-Prymnesium_polylepis.1
MHDMTVTHDLRACMPLVGQGMQQHGPVAGRTMQVAGPCTAVWCRCRQPVTLGLNIWGRPTLPHPANLFEEIVFSPALKYVYDPHALQPLTYSVPSILTFGSRAA